MMTERTLFDRMHPNSLEAYRGLNITQRQAQVYHAFEVLCSVTDLQVAEFLKMPINCVTPRVGELIDKGILVECGNIKIGNRNHRVCRIKTKTYL